MKIIISTCLLCCLAFFVNAQSIVTFVLETPPAGTYAGVGIRGSQAPLSWEKTTPLEVIDGKLSAQLTFPEAEVPLEFKFVYEDAKGKVNWEYLENRRLSLTGGALTYVASWDVEPLIDLATLPPFTVSALQKDYLIIEEAIRLHPGLYRYLTEEELTAQLAKLKAKFSQPLSVGEAYLVLSALTASIRCGHTGSPFFNQGAVVNSVIHRQADKLPFTFRWREERMLVVEDGTPEALFPLGTEILALNGVPVASILRELRQYVASDGPSVDPVDGILSLRGYPFRYDAFDVFYPLAFPFAGSSLGVSYRQPDGSLANATITTVTREVRTETLQHRYPEFPVATDDLWGLEIVDEETAILTVGDFSGEGAGALTLDPATFFAKAFADLKAKNIQNLILDVRENEGGNDPIVAELFTYFPFKYRKEADFEGRMRYAEFPESLKPIVKSWGEDPWYYRPKTDGYDADKGAYIIADEFANNYKNKVKKNAFRGRVCVLTGRINASLGFYLAKAVQDYQIGTLIGETTGGSLRGINGGQLLFIRLPNTNIELDLPVLGGFATTPQPVHGVVPAVPVTITAADQLAGQDVVLAAALSFLSEQKK